MSHPAHRVLIVGALSQEVRALRHHVQDTRPEGPWLKVGHLGAWEVGYLAVGVGREKARDRTRQALERWDAGWVLSVGTCGALVDDLLPGQVVSARAVLGHPPGALRVLPVLRPVNLVTVDQVVDRPQVRAELAGKGAQVCDMEAAGVLEACEDRTFSAVKVVSDRAGAGLDLLLPFPGPLRAVQVQGFRLRARLLGRLRLAPEIAGFLAGLPDPA